MELKVDHQKIKTLRLDKSWSQEKLADEAAVSMRTVQRMELDGSASLKSRRAVADALGVEPAFLDPLPVEKVEEAEALENLERLAPSASNKGFWSSLLGYPGPASISRKIRTPLLVTLWLGMMVTGGLALITTISITILSIISPDASYRMILIATFPILVIFVVCLGLYAFFKKYTSQA